MITNKCAPTIVGGPGGALPPLVAGDLDNDDIRMEAHLAAALARQFCVLRPEVDVYQAGWIIFQRLLFVDKIKAADYQALYASVLATYSDNDL